MKRPITPLAILLATMRQKWTAGEAAAATALARIAVPYVHARRTRTDKTVTPTMEAHQLTDEELALHLAASAPGAEHPSGDTGTPDRLG